MKRTFLTAILVFVLLVIVTYMLNDLFTDPSSKKSNTDNPFEYNIEQFKQVDTADIGYIEVADIDVSLSEVACLAVMPDGFTWVGGGDSVVVFDALRQLAFAANIGVEANCIAAGNNNLVYIGGEGRVGVFNSKGESVSTWPELGSKALITSVAVVDSFVFVADAGNKRVYKYNTEGKMLDTISTKEKGEVGFIIPSSYFDLAVNAGGELWVVNPGLHELDNFSMSGNLVSSWKSTSMELDGFSGCCNPVHIAFLTNGNFVTAEKGLVRVKVHSPDGKFVTVVAPPLVFDGDSPIADIATDKYNRVLLLDAGQKKIRIFTPK